MLPEMFECPTCFSGEFNLIRETEKRFILICRDEDCHERWEIIIPKYIDMREGAND